MTDAERIERLEREVLELRNTLTQLALTVYNQQQVVAHPYSASADQHISRTPGQWVVYGTDVNGNRTPIDVAREVKIGAL